MQFIRFPKFSTHIFLAEIILVVCYAIKEETREIKGIFKMHGTGFNLELVPTLIEAIILVSTVFSLILQSTIINL